MEELIKIRKSEGGKEVVSARDVHQALEVKKHFTEWFDDNASQFTEGVDYQALHLQVKAGPGYSSKTDYVLTIDMAKEMAMMSKVPKGKIVRQYFIACEKKLREASNFQLPATFSEALRLAADQHEEIEKQKIQLEQQSETITQSLEIIEEMKPKAIAADILLISEDTVTVGEFAKTLNTGQNRMFEKLRTDRFLISEGSKRNLPYQKYIEQGLFVVREVTKTADNKIKLFSQTQITPKGQVYLSNRYSMSKSV